jgi:hypothetical protein
MHLHQAALHVNTMPVSRPWLIVVLTKWFLHPMKIPLITIAQRRVMKMSMIAPWSLPMVKLRTV